MLVRALTRGFHEKIREEGEEFRYPDDAPVGSWMEIVEPPEKKASSGGGSKSPTKTELEALCEEKGIEVPTGAKKADLEALLADHESEGSDEGGEGGGDPLL